MMRRAESKALRERIARAIIDNDNELTTNQLRQRFPRATDQMISAVARSLGVQLPRSEYLGDQEMTPHTRTRAEQKEAWSRVISLWRVEARAKRKKEKEFDFRKAIK